MRTVAFCEIEPYPRAVLAKHWPAVPCYDDVRTLTADRLRSDGIAADIICGGFPCQDISSAGKGAGIADGTRSGLWSEYARIIGQVRPRFVIVENVSALLNRGLDRVLGDLAALGYDAEWHCIRAADVGAPHLRDRIWIVAYPQHTYTNGLRLYRAILHEFGDAEFRDEQERQPRSMGNALANANSPRLSIAWSESLGKNGQQSWRVPPTGDWWSTEPDVGRVAHGVPSRVDRLKGLGNAVVPQIPEIIGRAIMRSLSSQEQE